MCAPAGRKVVLEMTEPGSAATRYSRARRFVMSQAGLGGLSLLIGHGLHLALPAHAVQASAGWWAFQAVAACGIMGWTASAAPNRWALLPCALGWPFVWALAQVLAFGPASEEAQVVVQLLVHPVVLSLFGLVGFGLLLLARLFFEARGWTVSRDAPSG